MPRIKGIKSNNVKDTKNFDHKNKLILTSCVNYFKKNPSYLKELNNILNDKAHDVTIKKLHWFLETYCPNNEVYVDDKNIFNDYKTTMKKYSKKYFNVLKRGEKIDITIQSFKLNTTVPQMNFLKWAFTNKIIDRLRHLKAAEQQEDMLNENEINITVSNNQQQ